MSITPASLAAKTAAAKQRQADQSRAEAERKAAELRLKQQELLDGIGRFKRWIDGEAEKAADKGLRELRLVLREDIGYSRGDNPHPEYQPLKDALNEHYLLAGFQPLGGCGRKDIVSFEGTSVTTSDGSGPGPDNLKLEMKW